MKPHEALTPNIDLQRPINSLSPVENNPTQTLYSLLIVLVELAVKSRDVLRNEPVLQGHLLLQGLEFRVWSPEPGPNPKP